MKVQKQYSLILVKFQILTKENVVLEVFSRIKSHKSARCNYFLPFLTFIYVPAVRTETAKKSFYYNGSVVYNNYLVNKN